VHLDCPELYCPIPESSDMDQDVRKALNDTNAAITRMAGSVNALVDNLKAPAHPATQAESRRAITPGGWVGIVVGIVTIVGVIVGATWTISHEFGVVDQHIARVETAVRIVGAKQGGDTKTLIDEALTVAMNDSSSGKEDKAKTVLAIANRLIGTQVKTGPPLTQSDFNKVLVKYQALNKFPPLAQDVHSGITLLADYRSATLPAPPHSSSVYIGESGMIGNLRFFRDSVFIGENALSSSPKGTVGTVIDNVILENVVFRDATIVYNGGPLRLNKVQFINCRFRVGNSAHGVQFLEAAIKQESSLNIG
jgi:hypothetical protein